VLGLARFSTLSHSHLRWVKGAFDKHEASRMLL
jgi:hypothetical protein